MDIGWIREHTRLGELAQRWERRGRRGAMLSGEELKRAEAWLANQPRKAPQPTELHRAFIAMSRNAATRRQHAWIAGSLAAAVLATGLATWALWSEQRAQASLREARRNISSTRAQRAIQLLENDDPVLAMLVAIKGLPDDKSAREEQRHWPFVPEAEFALFEAWQANRETAVLKGHTAEVWSVAFDPSHARVVSASFDGTARLWNAQTGTEVALLRGHAQRDGSHATRAKG